METILDPEVVEELVRDLAIINGARVRKRRTDLKLSQRQLAKAAGMTVGSISRIESGTFVPRDWHKLMVASVLAVEVTDLWPPMSRAEITKRAFAA